MAGLDSHPGQRDRWEPVTDISETSGEFVFEVALPGVAREDIDLTLNGGGFTLEGVRGIPEVEGSLLVAERHFGRFAREFTLPEEFRGDPQADYRDGVLTIRFPKRGNPQAEGSGWTSPSAEQGPLPPIDVLDIGHGLLLRVDLPGIPQSAIDVLFEGQTLTLRGRRELESAGRRYLKVERPYGSFSRSILLPGGVEGEGINASYKDGVLSVELPASGTTSRPRKLGLRRRAASPAPARPEDPLQQLREELEELRAQHQALRSEMDGYWLALGCGLRLAQVPLHQHLPVEVSLRDGEPAVQEQVMAAVMGFVEFAGFELWRDLPPESGPFLKRWQVRTRRKESQLEFQQRLLRMQEALELARGGAMQAQEPRPEDFADAERQKLLGEAAKAWAEAIFTLATALRAAAVGASVLMGTLSLQKQEAAVVLRTLDEEELVSRLRNWSAVSGEQP
ncbi:Hsp20/alpha crystallin family protein [Archangium lansingense]|uniref:Hsp20/alpha crystallin family protein n=1 Tax=Archangium lansingense TaxID=2995310 RepID=UPI003B7CBFA9